MGGLGSLLAGMAAGGYALNLPHAGRARYPKGWRGGIGGNPASVNRWTGQRHEHAGEIARRERQAERVKTNRIARSCNGRGVSLAPFGMGYSRRKRRIAL